jgi:hypothetical protein
MDSRSAIWVKNDDFRQLLWTIAKQSLTLVNEIETATGLIKEYSINLDSLVSGYCERLYTVDKLHREFEQVVWETYGNFSPLEDLVSQARETYETYAAMVQEIFIGQVKQTGWPLENRLRSTRVFSELIDQHLKKRTRVAFFMVVTSNASRKVSIIPRHRSIFFCILHHSILIPIFSRFFREEFCPFHGFYVKAGQFFFLHF